jgi:4-hydroxy-3-methylbut-2-enyl diphosphate reductase IspH
MVMIVVDRALVIITRKRGHFAPVINYQRHLIFNMTAINKLREQNRVSYDIINNLSVDLFYDREKARQKYFKNS